MGEDNNNSESAGIMRITKMQLKPRFIQTNRQENDVSGRGPGNQSGEGSVTQRNKGNRYMQIGMSRAN